MALKSIAQDMVYSLHDMTYQGKAKMMNILNKQWFGPFCFYLDQVVATCFIWQKHNPGKTMCPLWDKEGK